LLRKSRFRRVSKYTLLKLRKRLVLEHIDAMMREAINQAVTGNIDLAERTAKFAKKLARWTGVKFPKKWRYYFCRKCKSFIMPGVTARVRIRCNRMPHIVIYCRKCKNYKRIPFIKNRKTNQG